MVHTEHQHMCVRPSRPGFVGLGAHRAPTYLALARGRARVFPCRLFKVVHSQHTSYQELGASIRQAGPQLRQGSSRGSQAFLQGCMWVYRPQQGPQISSSRKPRGMPGANGSMLNRFLFDASLLSAGVLHMWMGHARRQVGPRAVVYFNP